MIVYCFVFISTRLLHDFETKENYALKISQRNRRDLKIVQTVVKQIYLSVYTAQALSYSDGIVITI